MKPQNASVPKTPRARQHDTHVYLDYELKALILLVSNF